MGSQLGEATASPFALATVTRARHSGQRSDRPARDMRSLLQLVHMHTCLQGRRSALAGASKQMTHSEASLGVAATSLSRGSPCPSRPMAACR